MYYFLEIADHINEENNTTVSVNIIKSKTKLPIIGWYEIDLKTKRRLERKYTFPVSLSGENKLSDVLEKLKLEEYCI